MNTKQTIYQVGRTFLLISSLSFSIAHAQTTTDSKHLVATNDCGNVSKQGFLIKGDNYTLPLSIEGSETARTCSFGGSIIYAFDQIDIHSDYWMEVTFLADAERTISISADGNAIVESMVIPRQQEIKKRIQLPRKAYAYGQLVLIFDVIKGPNAIVNELNIYSTNQKPLTAFAGDKKEALKATQSYIVDQNVDVEAVLPTYAPLPAHVAGIYNPVISLNGIWQFAEKANSNKWQPIEVPGQWSMQGFQVDSAQWGHYKRDFLIPTDWNDKQVKLRFDGVHSEYKVLINGKEAGYHMGGMTPYEINITNLIRQNAGNEVELLVRSESMADMLGSLTQYAAHQLGGITRKVTLFALPNVHITDLRIETDLDDTYTNAKLRLRATVANDSKEVVEDTYIRIALDKHQAATDYKLPRLTLNETWTGTIELDVEKPLLWDNEHPNLYSLNVDLCLEGSSTQGIKKQVGFREVEVKGNRVFVNGTPIKLRGVCRHEAHPLTGRVLTTELREKDAELFRDANCNFIRTSHYPPGEEFIEACDRLGLFVEVESPVCWIGHHANENWQTLNYRDTQYYPYVLQANMETIHFYRNHPSVIFWSMANESYWNKEFAQVLEYMRKADTTRPSAFHDQAYGGFNNQGSTSPIANIHYPGPNGYKAVENSDRPMVYGEYCHLNVYNRSELVTDPGVRSDWALALAPTWDNMYKTDAVLGGSIWSGIDDIFQMPDGSAVGYGPWGPIDGWRRPKPEYWDMKKSYSPIRLHTQKLDPSATLNIEIENRYTFTDLDELRIEWKYGNETGTAKASLAPGKTGIIPIQISSPEQANQLYLRFIDPKGFVADEYLLPVGKQTQNEMADLETLKTTLSQKNNLIIAKGKNYECSINKNSGQIVSMIRNGKEIINGGPWLMALPLTGGGCYPNHNANTPPFNELCSEWNVKSVNTDKEEDDVLINVEGSYKEFDGSYTLRINANGEMQVTYSFDALQDVNPRQWGLVFEAPKEFDQLFWRREGLWSVYPEDHISRTVGTADLYYKGVPDSIHARIQPTWAWSRDHNQLGSNDFRSTRRNIWYAGLNNQAGNQITIRSNGQQHWRSWLHNDRIRFLIAEFVTAGNEMFLEGYYAPYRKPVKAGDTISGAITLRIE